MADIVLHMGLHKTATSALQGQFFPACTDLRFFTNLGPEMYRFVEMVTKRDPIYFDPEEARALLRPLLDERKPNLLSNEMFSGPPYAGVIEKGLDHRSPVVTNLSAAFPDARAILVLRRQDGLARSFYRQYLKSGGTVNVRRFYGFDSRGRPPLMSLDRFQFSPYIEAVKAAFPRGVLLLAFESFVEDQAAFLDRICAFIGVERPNVELKRENATTLGPFGMEVTRLANHLFRSFLNPGGVVPGLPIRDVRGSRFTSPVYILHDIWPGKAARANQGEIGRTAQQVFERVRDDNRILDDKYGLDLRRYGYY